MAKAASNQKGQVYDDPRFKQVDDEKNAALNEVDQTYGEMIGDTKDFYQDQIDASKDWAKEQEKLQNEQTDFAIEKIEQQKQQAQQDYTKEQSGAYVDWQKQSNQYGVNAEKQAAMGMQNTGFSESSQVSMYNQYQTRVAMARESLQRAMLNFDNGITEARLQNNAALAQIRAEALEKQLALALEGFQYQNTLVQAQADRKQQLNEFYHTKWQDVQSQINTEKALAEEIRQYNEKMAEEKRQFNQQMALEKEQFAWQKEQAKKSSSSSGGGSIKGSSSSSSSSSSSGNKINQTSSNSSSSKKNGEVDMQSILSLGYGPISAKKAMQLVEQGLAETYTKNGKTYFRKSASYVKQESLFGKNNRSTGSRGF